MGTTGAVDRRQFVRGLVLAAASASPLFGEGKQFAPCDLTVDSYVRQHRFQGVVALGRGGKTLYSRQIGFADFETKRPMSQLSVFGIASISKMLTTVTVLKLVEKNVLALDQPILAYLPEYRKDLGNKLTLRRLLANNSGVPNLLSPALKADPTLVNARMTTMEAVHRFSEGDLLFSPGERFDYSISNWILVLAIVEAVTKTNFATAMHQITHDPLGLKNTSTDAGSKTATAYTDATPPVKRLAPRQPFMAAAGGYYSDANDLMLAGHRVFNGNFVSSASLHSLTTIEVSSDQYALGGRIRQVSLGAQSVTAAWDTGNTSGYRSVLGHRLDGQGTVVILNNTSMSQKTLDEFSDALLASFASE